MSETVHLKSDARGVATLTIDRAERRNAFDQALIAELTALARAVPDASRCVVLRTAGDVFCAGADIEWMRSMARYSLEENVADSRALAAMYAALDDFPMPLIARVQGAAIGGGAGLVAVADIAVASDSASFAFTEVRLGILPAVISPYVVRKVGPAFATATFITGIRFDASRAFDKGLVSSVVHGHDLDAEVDRFVAAIIECGPQAVREAKRLVRDVTGRTPAEVRDLTVERIAKIRASDEGQEGMRAFLDKRKPAWATPRKN